MKRITMGKSLLLTLGHNSSAIFLEDGVVICGYETERLSKIKSDSAFPELAIEEIAKQYAIPVDVDIYVSHWFTDGKLEPSKWWRPSFITAKFPCATVYHVGDRFTHHDAHCWSAIAFTKKLLKSHDTMIIVADGFGTFGETMSLYKNRPTGPDLFHRSFGFDSSLGLLYQYTTSFLGMKENQDEYKMLGYEAHIDGLHLLKTDIEKINNFTSKMVKKLFKLIQSYDLNVKYDPVISLDALPALKYYYHKLLNNFVVDLELVNEHDIRIAVAYAVQSIVEKVMLNIVKKYKPRNLILTGGLFLNVKLNSLLSKLITGKTFIMPLAGDQGAAIGVYEANNGDFNSDGICWGTRDLGQYQSKRLRTMSAKDAKIRIIELLEKDHIVNVVKGSMEFGPRALCNTSTLALPTKENVEYINALNGRSTIMPMAPVLCQDDASNYFYNINHIITSLKYMVCTRDYHVFKDSFSGAGHKVPFSNEHTGRPQLVTEKDDPFIYGILKNFGILINTSFNIHGQPIVYGIEDVIRHHRYQQNSDVRKVVHTIIIN